MNATDESTRSTRLVIGNDQLVALRGSIHANVTKSWVGAPYGSWIQLMSTEPKPVETVVGGPYSQRAQGARPVEVPTVINMPTSADEGAPEPPPVTERLPPAIAVGQVVGGKYKVERRLGEGGMGVVFSARHLELDERVAIKVLRAEMLSQPELVGRFSREARAAVRIKSEHVARVFDVGRLDNGTPYIVMEHLEGADLAVKLREGEMLAVDVVVEYVLQACEALGEAHSLGIVHRDVKPENLFLARRGAWSSIKVLDFGISKTALAGISSDNVAATQDTALMGSPLYMAPEQIRGMQSVDHRIDVWALGCVLHELLSGRPAFRGDSITHVCASILEDPPPTLRNTRPDVPLGLDTIIARCLEKSPDARFQNVAELAIALLPYGPRRARISVERTSSIIRASGLAKMELSVPGSMAPPSDPDADVVADLRIPASPRLPGSETNHALATTESKVRSPRSKLPLVLGAVALVAAIVAGVLARKSEPASAPVAASAEVPRMVQSSAAAPAAPPPVAVPASAALPAASTAAPTTATSAAVRKSSRPKPRAGEIDLGF